MAQIAHYTKQHSNFIVIIRFMGLTRETASIKLVFNSLVNHLNALFKHDQQFVEQLSQNESLFAIREKFLKQLFTFSMRFPDKKIVFLLDSIEKLTRRDTCLDWLIYELPTNIKMILSVDSENEMLFEIVKTKFECVLLEKLEFDEAKSMLLKLMQDSNRKISDKQMLSIEDLLVSTSEIYPLHIKLIFDIISKWLASTKVPNELMSCINSKETIKYIFKSCEKNFGELFFSRCIFYISFFNYRGISDAEMQDLLTIDDEVLNGIFKNYHPSIRRFPIALWLSVKYELRDYLIEKEIDGVCVTAW